MKPRVPEDPKKSAIALAYRSADAAPRVVAKGRGLIAEEIIARAREHGVFVHESPELVSLLMQIDLDERIPPQLYQAVAELLAWLYQLDRGLLDSASKPTNPAPTTPASSDADTTGNAKRAG